MIPNGLKYTSEHEWIRVEGTLGTIGITHFAQSALGDVVFVELPEVGRILKQGETFGVVESVKTVSDLYSPVSGKVVRVNEKLMDAPETVNQAPYGDGWMIVIEFAAPAELGGLLDAKAYEQVVAEAAH
jgi:glycine cleavage system H protein